MEVEVELVVELLLEEGREETADSPFGRAA
jgi:hypothetical protein